jgi:hypothetical protein
MEPKHNKYPIFEANQVLTNTHLNNIFDYLDEQERLTRARLIGIGIVCGLEIRKDVGATTTIHLSKGCGVTSRGYLILEPEDVTLTSYRAGYIAPDDPDEPDQKGYAPFNQPASNTQYPLWELFPAGEPNTTPLNSPAGFLDDKVVLLFLELKKDDLRNCSPNNCDDKGAEVTTTVRRLLITRSNLEDIIAVANGLSVNLSPADLAAALTAQLGLKDIRLPRYDVPNSAPATSEDVLIGFFEAFHGFDLAATTSKALTAAYTAFKPLLKDLYPVNPFTGLPAVVGFLDTAPQNAAQVRFLQYYYDLFDDLLKAYDEFRWAAAELLCACCPSQDLFPRHLMLGEASPSANAVLYRQTFLASPAVSGCEQRAHDLRLLFQRLVEMTRRFTNNPTSPAPPDAKPSAIDAQIRITPSKLADVPLSAKCIPYYYTQDGTPPLYKLWSPEKTRRGRADQNLSYRADEYASELFARNPLRYDLEPYNFLRIEGHLGKNYRTVLQTLLAMKSQYRLPIDIVALRTGAFDEKMTVDLSKEECRFQDLDSLYRTLREDLRCFLCKEMQYFYEIQISTEEFSSDKKTSYSPQEPLLKACAPTFIVNPQTLGDYFETLLKTLDQSKYSDPDDFTNIRFNPYFRVGTNNSSLFFLLYHMSKLAESLLEQLSEVDFAELENRYRDLEKVAVMAERNREESIPQLVKDVPQAEIAPKILTWEELDDRIEAIMYACRLDAFKAIRDEYVRRIREARQRQFLSFFLQKNPGVQHKAGVPLGGTFIIVYHDDPDPVVTPGVFTLAESALNLRAARTDASVTSSNIISAALNRLKGKADLVIDPDIQLIFAELTGQIPTATFPGGSAGVSQDTKKIFTDTVNQLADGTVIADFFLPYLCCSDCAPIQFVLPPPPIGFSVALGCTNANGRAEATITPQGGAAPYTIQLDNGVFRPLTGKPSLTVGDHTIVIRDSAGVESAPQTVTVPAMLTIGTGVFTDDVPKQKYQVSFSISGGVAPYTADSGTINGNTYTSGPVDSGASITVGITDSVGCKASQTFTHKVAAPCTLPCDGISRRCAYRLWAQPPAEGAAYEIYRLSRISLRFNSKEIPLPNVNTLFNVTASDLNSNFPVAIGNMIGKLNEMINKALVTAIGPDGNNRLVLTYKPTTTDPFGILWIEYFVCESFNLELEFDLAKPSPAFSVIMRYTNEPPATGGQFNGVVLINKRLNNKETRVPAFDCSERNQCAENQYKKLCEGPQIKPSFKVSRVGANQLQLVSTTPSILGTEFVAWVWDPLNARPDELFYSGEKVSATVQSPSGFVRLTIITKTGCFGVLSQEIAL